MAKRRFCGCDPRVPLHLLGLRTYGTRGHRLGVRLERMEGLIGDAPDPETQATHA